MYIYICIFVCVQIYVYIYDCTIYTYINLAIHFGSKCTKPHAKTGRRGNCSSARGSHGRKQRRVPPPKFDSKIEGRPKLIELDQIIQLYEDIFDKNFPWVWCDWTTGHVVSSIIRHVGHTVVLD